MKKVIFSALFIFVSIISFSSPLVIASKKSSTQSSIQNHEGQLIDIFKSMDKSILKSSDEKLISEYLIGKNNEIVKYLINKYPQKLPMDSIDVNDPMCIYFGLFMAMVESNQINEGEAGKMAPWLECVGGVVFGAIGVYDIIHQAQNLSFNGAWSLVKKLVRRYLGWWSAAVCIYDIVTTCF